MAESAKTRPTDASVAEFVASVPNETARADSELLIDLMGRITGHEAQMWGPAIIGFGSVHYRYDSGREGDMPVLGFSPRVGKLSIYLDSTEAHADQLARLGRHSTSKVCLYVKKLGDVDLSVLEQILRDTRTNTLATYGS